MAIIGLIRVMPQSNQRGIETPVPTLAGQQDLGPQSNQRGIETPHADAHAELDPAASIEPAWD